MLRILRKVIPLLAVVRSSSVHYADSIHLKVYFCACTKFCHVVWELLLIVRCRILYRMKNEIMIDDVRL